jgi:hypothetical protein
VYVPGEEHQSTFWRHCNEQEFCKGSRDVLFGHPCVAHTGKLSLI